VSLLPRSRTTSSHIDSPPHRSPHLPRTTCCSPTSSSLSALDVRASCFCLADDIFPSFITLLFLSSIYYSFSLLICFGFLLLFNSAALVGGSSKIVRVPLYSCFLPSSSISGIPFLLLHYRGPVRSLCLVGFSSSAGYKDCIRCLSVPVATFSLLKLCSFFSCLVDKAKSWEILERCRPGLMDKLDDGSLW
jgi:hypothetical protein